MYGNQYYYYLQKLSLSHFFKVIFDLKSLFCICDNQAKPVTFSENFNFLLKYINNYEFDFVSKSNFS